MAAINRSHFTLTRAGSISGTVYESDGQTTIPDLHVFAVDAASGEWMAGVNTDKLGHYVLYVPTGTYKVRACPGCSGQNYVDEWYGGALDQSDAQQVSVTAPEDQPGIDFSLDDGCGIAGYVYEQDGQTPITSGAVVANGQNVPYGQKTPIAADGSYVLQGLPPGTYLLQAFADGYISEYYDGAYFSEDASPVELLTPGEIVQGYDFTMDPGGVIYGYVYDESTSNPIPYASVNVDLWTGGYGFGVKTDAGGYFEIGGLPPGDYRIAAWANNYANEFYDGVYGWNSATPVPVVPPGWTQVDFLLGPGGSISGQVTSQATGKPLSGISIDCPRIDGEGGGGATTDDKGFYFITGLPFGQYKLSAPSEKRYGKGDDNYAREFYNEKTDFDSADIVTVSAESSPSDVNFTLTGGGSISGKVFKEDGQTPLEGVSVNATEFDTKRWVGSAKTGADGGYTIGGLSTGTYRMEAWAEGTVRELWENTLRFDQATPVEVTAPNAVMNIDFTLEPGGAISGTVFDFDTGEPLAFVSVEVGHTDIPLGGGTQTDEFGNYRVTGLPYGQYWAASPNSGRHGPGDDNFLKEYYDGKASLATADILTVSEETPEVAGVNFSLKQGGTISGRVVDEQGDGIEGASVDAMVMEDSQNGWNARTDAEGYYQIKGLPSGDYMVMAFATGKVRKIWENTFNKELATPVPVTAPNDTPDINFTLEQGGEITGTVTSSTTGLGLANVSVNANRISDGAGFGATTDSTGHYKINGLPFGQYRANAPQGFGSGDDGYARQYFSGKADQSTADLITVSAETPAVGGINFSLSRGGTISGHVTDEATGNPVIDAGAGTIELGAGWHKFVYRFEENGGWQAARAAFKAPGDTAWRSFSTSELQIKTTLAPEAPAGIFLTNKKNPWTGQPLSHLEMVECVDVDSTTDAGWYGQEIVQSVDQTGNAFGNDDFYTSYYEAYFYVDTAGTWSFSTISDDSSEICIDDQVVAYWYEWAWDFAGRWENRASLGLWNADTGAWVAGTVTQPDGSYAFTSLAPGKYRIGAKSPGYAAEHYQEQDTPEGATIIVIAADTEYPEVNFTLEKAGSLSGHVSAEEGGTPLSDVMLLAYSATPAPGTTGSACAMARTDSAGNYQIIGLAPGNYYIRAVGVAGYASIWYSQVFASAEATPVAVIAQTDHPGVDFSLPPGGSFSGHVYMTDGQTPVNGAAIYVIDNAGEVRGGSRTGPDGAYKTGGVGPGFYKLVAQAPGLYTEWYDGVPNESDATWVQANIPYDVPGIDFTLDLVTRTLTIEVVGNGTTIPGAGVHAYAHGIEVELTANPGPGFVFTHWGGDIFSKSRTITVTMDGDRSMIAYFIQAGYTWIGAIKFDPARFEGTPVNISGQYLGWASGYGNPPVSKSDSVIQDPTGFIYVTGNTGLRYPRDVGAPIWLRGIVKLKDGVPYIVILAAE